jgi:LPPG:FO 2-phospho-L-lactate transferase
VAEPGSVVCLAGGVGGAKLAHGLQAQVGNRLTVVVNTGDDLERHGLLVMPDHDTVMYTLAGLANRDLGWGLEGETFNAAAMLERYGEETWFRLGDRDLATHITRTAQIRNGERLTDVCRALQRSLGVSATILPMTDHDVRTEVKVDEGWIDFQDYFVARHQEPEVRDVRFQGIGSANATKEVRAAIEGASAIVIGPSNPIVSIGPILELKGVRASIGSARMHGARIVAISGIVGGKAIRGPADRMLASLGHDASAMGVARLYADLATDFVLDRVDGPAAAAIQALGPRAHVSDTIMADDAGRARLAGEVLAIAGVA